MTWKPPPCARLGAGFECFLRPETFDAIDSSSQGDDQKGHLTGDHSLHEEAAALLLGY